MRITSNRRRIGLGAALALAAGLATSLAGAAPAGAHTAGPHFQTVISGLNAPRGITFDGQGSMYAAQSGVAGAGANGLTHSGRVSKYPRGSTHPVWTTTFESLYATEDPTQPPDVLGPAGMSALGGDCGAYRRHDWHDGDRHDGDRHDRGGCTVRLIVSESHDGIAAMTNGAIQTKDAGHLYALNPRTGRATSKSDVGDQMYAFTTAHKSLFPSDFPDSNPYGVLVTRGRHDHRVRTFVADAGANTISEIMPNGHARIIAYIPNETAAPFRDATPTCIAQGPDGMLYVATLHLVANFSMGPGKSDVWRVNPNANFPTLPTRWATGLTTPTACTFDRHGTFWATETFQPTSGAPGDIVGIPFWHPSHLIRVGAGHLPLPGGIAQGPDGDLYVTVNSANPAPGSGAIVRVDLH